MLTLMLEMNQLPNFSKKKNKKTNKQKKAVTLHEAYKSPVHKKLKEGEAI